MFHRHDWVAVGVWQGECIQIKGLATLVLFWCSACRDVRTQTLDGVWTLEQVKGEVDARRPAG